MKMRESWSLSTLRLLSWVSYLKTDPKELKEDFEAILYNLESSSYPKNVDHLLKTKKQHEYAVNCLQEIADTTEKDYSISFYHDIETPIDSWIITKEKIEEMIQNIEENQLENVQQFLDSLNYTKYLQATEAGFLELDRTMVKSMLHEHQQYIFHLEKAIKNRRIRILLH